MCLYMCVFVHVCICMCVCVYVCVCVCVCVCFFVQYGVVSFCSSLARKARPGTLGSAAPKVSLPFGTRRPTRPAGCQRRSPPWGNIRVTRWPRRRTKGQPRLGSPDNVCHTHHLYFLLIRNPMRQPRRDWAAPDISPAAATDPGRTSVTPGLSGARLSVTRPPAQSMFRFA